MTGKLTKPENLDVFMFGLMKEARRHSLNDFLEMWCLDEEDFQEISNWFNKELGIKLI